MRRLVVSDVVLGKAIPFALCDERGRLLLRQGTVITSDALVERLVLRGAVIERLSDAGTPGANVSGEADEGSRSSSPAAASPPRPADEQPVFDQVEGLALNLRHLFSTQTRAPEQIDLPQRIRSLAVSLQAMCAKDVDSALAAPYVDHQTPYIVVHHLMGAVITEILAARKGLSPAERLSYVCAALTRDMGQLGIQSELEQTTGPLPESLAAAVRNHPAAGVELLKSAGVADGLWLDAVLAHHERLDGSGYPRRLAGGDVGLGARILAIADMYSAMARARPYRPKVFFPQAALRDMYQKKDSHLDGELIQLLIKEIGMLPPGVLVKLKCGEIAVLRKRTFKAEGATVYSVYDRNSMPMVDPVRRETQTPGFEIIGMVPFSQCKSATLLIKRLWMK